MPRRWTILFYSWVGLWGFLLGVIWYLSTHILSESQHHVDHLVEETTKYMRDQLGEAGVLDWQRTLARDPHRSFLEYPASRIQLLLILASGWGVGTILLWKYTTWTWIVQYQRRQSQSMELEESLHRRESEIQGLQNQFLEDRTFWSHILHSLLTATSLPAYILDDSQRLIGAREVMHVEWTGQSWIKVPLLKSVGTTLSASFESPDIPICIALAETKTATFLTRIYPHNRKAIFIYLQV